MEILKRIKEYYLPSPPRKKAEEPVPITGSINEDAAALRRLFDNSADLTLKTAHLGNNTVMIAALEGLCDKEMIAMCITNPIANCKTVPTGKDIYTFLKRDVITCNDVISTCDLAETSSLMMSGFAAVFVQGSKKAVAVGVQGYSYRNVDEPQTEVLQRGSREGFSEPLKVNQALIRRRIKSTDLKFENIKIGELSQTDVCICFLRNIADDRMIEEIRSRLEALKLESLIASGYLVEALDKGSRSLFNGVGVTERPDTACAKLCEGKIVILVDGSPSALVVPHLMVENFSTLDDYSNRPYFAAMTRWLKYAAFLISVLLPGIYVALAGFSPEFFPNQLLTRVTTAVSKTPFSVFSEVLLFTFIYEIMREAGLRLPKTLGHAVSIIGGLVIGDTAVNSGFIGAPTLMIVALTVICSYVIPDLYAPISVLRFLFIIFGGIWGMWGITLMICVMTADLCSKESMGVPFMLPIAPLDPFGLRDVVVRAPWSVLSRKRFIPKKEGQ